jgi:hypothetical protein
MKKNAMYFWSLLTTSVAGVSFAQADVSDAQMRNLENRVNALEQRKSANGMINPSGRPQVRDGFDVFVTGDWLIWQAHENGLGYVVKNKGTTLPNLSHSSIRDLHYDWDFGFRVGLGFNMPHDGWDIYANWTWFRDHAHGRQEASSTSSLLPVWAMEDSFEPNTGATKSHAHWKLWLNMVDLELGREFFVSKWMTLRPFVGLRTGWIHQKLDIDYKHLTVDGVLSATDDKYEVDMKNNYWGLGLKGGLNSQWGLGAGFSFYGNAAVSLLYGFFHLHHNEELVLLSGTSEEFIHNTQSFRVGRAISELALGLRWDTMFANDRCHFGIQGGWEHLMFFGQNQFQRFLGQTSSNVGSFVANQGDLTIQGWTLAARLDF